MGSMAAIVLAALAASAAMYRASQVGTENYSFGTTRSGDRLAIDAQRSGASECGDAGRNNPFL